MNTVQIGIVAAFAVLASGCTTTTHQQPTRSASGASLELLDACSRVTTDYLNSLNISATYTPENPPEETPEPEETTSEKDQEPNLLESLPDDVDPMIPMCMSLIDREIEAQTYILASRPAASTFYDYGYWHPRSYNAYGSYRYGYGYHTSPFFGHYRVYNRGFGHRRYTNYGHYHRHGYRNARSSGTNTGRGTTPTPTPSPTPPRQPATPAPAPRPRPATPSTNAVRNPPPRRNRTEQSNRRERR